MKPSIAEVYLPDPTLDRERLELINSTIGPLIDRHLNWVPVEESPSREIPRRDYGYVPKQFSSPIDAAPKQTEVCDDEASQRIHPVELRPRNEPLDFRFLSGSMLGVDPERTDFEDRVRAVDGFGELVTPASNGWYSALLRYGLMSKEQIVAMRNSSAESYRLNSLTEDNDPSYVVNTLGLVLPLAQKAGMDVDALIEWFRGIWPGEEDKHKDSMRDYGTIMRLTTSREHHFGQNSQLRAGISVPTKSLTHVFTYVPRQEFSTRTNHHNNGSTFGPIGHMLQSEMANDETNHYDLYTNVLRALYKDERFTEEVIMIIYQTYPNFDMPGLEGIPLFVRKAAHISNAGIYGKREDFEAARIVLRRIGMFDRKASKEGIKGSYIDPPGLSDQAAEALASLRETYDSGYEEKPPKRSPPLFVLGKTVTVTELRNARKRYAEEIGINSPRKLAT